MKNLLILILILFIFGNGFSSGENSKISNLKFTDNFSSVIYLEEDILAFEKIFNIKFPKLAIDIYKNKINIKDLIFLNEKNEDVEIEKILKLDCDGVGAHIMYSRMSFFVSWPPSKTTIPFGSNNLGDLFYIDNDCMWHFSHGSCSFKLLKLNKIS